MYLFENSIDRTGPVRFAGFSEPLDQGQFQKSLATIEAALDRYLKGRLAKTALEEAFKSVPLAVAARIHVELETGKGPVAKLFRSRIPPTVQREMLMILDRKVMAFRQQEEEKLRREVEKARQLEEARRKEHHEMRRKQGEKEANSLCADLVRWNKESEEALESAMLAERRGDREGARRFRSKMLWAEKQIAGVAKRLIELGFKCQNGRPQYVGASRG